MSPLVLFKKERRGMKSKEEIKGMIERIAQEQNLFLVDLTVSRRIRLKFLSIR